MKTRYFLASDSVTWIDLDFPEKFILPRDFSSADWTCLQVHI